MKNLINSKVFAMTLALVFLASSSCSDLEEELYSDLSNENFFQNDEENNAALGAAYANLGSFGNHFNLFTINEIASDELVISQKGGDWFDGGVLIQLHRHQFTPDNNTFDSSWGVIYGGITTCNRLISQFEELGQTSVIPELRALRAFWYYWGMDAFGNIPLQITFSDEVIGNNSSFQAGRTEVFNFVESEILEVLPELREGVGGADYAKFNQAAAHALLCRMYLNAEVYTGTARYADAIEQAEIVEGFGFSLSNAYLDNFVVQNDGSPENIFVVPYDQVNFGGFNWNAMNNSTAAQAMFQFTFQPWNGYQTVEEFYNSYVDPVSNPGPQGPVWTGLSEFSESDPTTPNDVGTQDDRLGQFVVGPQLRLDNGELVEDPGFEDFDPDGVVLNHTPELNELEPNGWRQGGARNQKYEFEIGGTENMSNDFVIFRLAATMLNKAEAMWRMNPGSTEALAIVNEIRERSGVDPYTALTEDNLLAERGRELYAELHRRQDLIRFGRWGDEWWEKGTSSEQYEVFPIPQQQIDVNSLLNQNPGY